MRFTVELLLEKEKISKDKNRIILSLIKKAFSSYDTGYYKELYENEENKMKDFTFSMYMGHCKFLREEILIPSKKISLNFSTYSSKTGIMFFNSFLDIKGIKQAIGNNMITIGKINMVKEKPILNDEVVFKTLSPIVVREHNSDNSKTWYYSLKDKEGQAVFRKNLTYQLCEELGKEALTDIKNLEFTVANNIKIVKVKNYGIEVHSNLGKIKIKAKPYILDYLYKAGVGSKRSIGFGMLDIV
ncbi:CRISPR-associated endoribonuclease Cas6 [Clostridium sp. D2Q-11]|uniref:CRISPR-associated endoribonuclease Cas6 n=1 Tax=Anaeromonas frigoriresistens TaxID=2683708 RepID=A0A942Z613_9FIRM|nr:CRISPR-associated endoribonuclease Cas6 [Anaeromonas frigoriresistens]MBS4537082.1 CRISPR-associated endoribonuclease Cas6 [Anaeromonas frigoriresistens]